MKFLSVLSLLIIVSFATSCKRRGCTDPLANNYEKYAVKADDDQCKYGDPNEAPCGEGIEFCTSYGNDGLSGEMVISEPSEGATRLSWTDSTDAENRLFEITLFGNDPGTYEWSQFQSDGTFQAYYFSDITGAADAVSGEIEVTSFTLVNGISGNFQMVMSDSTEVTEGNLFKVK